MAAKADPRVDPSFDRYARMVGRALDVPIALVTIAEGNREVFPGGVHGLPEPYELRRPSPMSQSLCQYVVRGRKPLVVQDLRLDESLACHLELVDLGVAAYAGFPVTDHRGDVIGSLCAIDSRPRAWSEGDLATLEDLAGACSAEVAQRELRRFAVHEGTTAQEMVDRGRLLLALSEVLSATTTLVEIATAVDDVAVAQLGCKRAALWLLPEEARRSWADGFGDGLRKLDLIHLAGDTGASVTRHTKLSVDGANPVGDVLLKQQPRFFVTREEQQVEYPDFFITETFGDSRAFLPLTLGDSPVGILVLGWPGTRDFDEDERATIGALATYSAQAVHRAMLLQERLDTSLTLQQAMLTELPQPAGLELAARYRPAATWEQVGGDWYDALVLPSGSTGLVCGDVVGHDITAAAAMGQMRSMLRSFAWAIDDGPSNTVEQLDRALPGLGVEALATLVYGRVDPPVDPDGLWGLRWTSAGHPPPMLVRPDGQVEALTPAQQDLLLGVLPEEARHVDGVEVEPGSTLLLYTDGLIERRGESLEVGLARLTDALAGTASVPVEALVERVCDRLLLGTLEDDVAILAVRFG